MDISILPIQQCDDNAAVVVNSRTERRDHLVTARKEDEVVSVSYSNVPLQKTKYPGKKTTGVEQDFQDDQTESCVSSIQPAVLR
jgi:hypothetical protein